MKQYCEEQPLTRTVCGNDAITVLCIQYVWMILHNYFILRNCLSRGPVVEIVVQWWKIDLNRAKNVIIMFSERCHGILYYLNENVLLDFNIWDIYLLFAIFFLSQIQNSIYYQNLKPK